MQYTLLRCLHTLYVYVYTVCTCTTTAAQRVLQLLLLLVVVSCIASLTRRVGFSWGCGAPPQKAFGLPRGIRRATAQQYAVYCCAGDARHTCMCTYSLHSWCLASLWCAPRACGAMHVTTFPCAMHRLPAYACRHMHSMCTCTLCTSRYAHSCPHAAPSCMLTARVCAC